jgi:predicted small secreted protein
MRTLIKLCCTLLLAVVILSLAGCHTVAGMGEDIEAGGKAIENASHEAAP